MATITAAAVTITNYNSRAGGGNRFGSTIGTNGKGSSAVVVVVVIIWAQEKVAVVVSSTLINRWK